MVTITRKIKSRRGMPALRMQLTSRLVRRARPSEPADGWFTLQTEPGDTTHPESVAIASLRSEAVDQEPEHASGSLAVRSGRNERYRGQHRMLHALKSGRPWLLAAIAVIGALGATAILVVSSQGTGDRTVIVAQRARIAQLAGQRDQAVITARQAQSGQAAWRVQAARWRSRALARTSGSGRRRSTPGRRRARRAGRRKMRGSTTTRTLARG